MTTGANEAKAEITRFLEWGRIWKIMGQDIRAADPNYVTEHLSMNSRYKSNIPMPLAKPEVLLHNKRQRGSLNAIIEGEAHGTDFRNHCILFCC
jgi:hypothetical protein